MSSLRIYRDLVQGTDEWLEARRGIVTASVVGQLLTAGWKVAANDTSRALTATLVAERIAGFVEPVHVTDDMWRGTWDEPLARSLYAVHHAPVEQVGFMVRDLAGGPLGFSPDGLVGDDGAIECKSRKPRLHLRTILDDQVPAMYLPQIQAGLLVSGRQWCDFVSYSGGMPLWVKRVHADPAMHQVIEEAVRVFEDAAAQMTATYHAAVVGLPMTERVDHDMEMTL